MSELSDRDRRMLLYGMSMARGVLMALGCPPEIHNRLGSYQEVLSRAWSLDAERSMDLAMVKRIIREANAAIAAVDPEAMDISGR